MSAGWGRGCQARAYRTHYCERHVVLVGQAPGADTTMVGPRDNVMDAERLPPYWPARPPRISGTAMPTGVHLSDGRVRTSSDFELVLTGAAIMAMGAVSAVVTYLIVWVIDGFTPAPTTALLLGVLSDVDMARYAGWQVLINLLMFFCFLLVLRASPMAGYHAAEHMTVAAIEQTGRLDPDIVRQMPRAHPRCGTTLLAGILPAVLIAAPLWSTLPEVSTIIVVGGWLARHQLGYILQQLLTTKRPTPAQLQAGIRAGQRLLEAARSTPGRPQSPAGRLWQRGFVQMAIGVLATMWAIRAVYAHLHIWLDW